MFCLFNNGFIWGYNCSWPCGHFCKSPLIGSKLAAWLTELRALMSFVLLVFLPVGQINISLPASLASRLLVVVHQPDLKSQDPRFCGEATSPQLLVYEFNPIWLIEEGHIWLQVIFFETDTFTQSTILYLWCYIDSWAIVPFRRNCSVWQCSAITSAWRMSLCSRGNLDLPTLLQIW